MGEISDEEVNECVLFNYNINFFFWQGCESLFLVGTRARFQVMYARPSWEATIQSLSPWTTALSVL
jgi:hypothetical protein